MNYMSYVVLPVIDYLHEVFAAGVCVFVLCYGGWGYFVCTPCLYAYVCMYSTVLGGMHMFYIVEGERGEHPLCYQKRELMLAFVYELSYINE